MTTFVEGVVDKVVCMYTQGQQFDDVNKMNIIELRPNCKIKNINGEKEIKRHRNM